jgi:hypothetical protein
MFCAPRLIFGGIEGVASNFHVFNARPHFRRYRGRPVPFSSVMSASCPLVMFCAPRLVFGGPEGDKSRFHFLRSRTPFRRHREWRFPLSYFALPDSFSAVTDETCPIFMFCAPGHVFGSTEGVESCFHVLRSQSRFPRYRGRRLPFLCFARPDLFFARRRASGPIVMF